MIEPKVVVPAVQYPAHKTSRWHQYATKCFDTHTMIKKAVSTPNPNCVQESHIIGTSISLTART